MSARRGTTEKPVSRKVAKRAKPAKKATITSSWFFAPWRLRVSCFDFPGVEYLLVLSKRLHSPGELFGGRHQRGGVLAAAQAAAGHGQAPVIIVIAKAVFASPHGE